MTVRTGQHGVDVFPAQPVAGALGQRDQAPQQGLFDEHLGQVPLEPHRAQVISHACGYALRRGA